MGEELSKLLSFIFAPLELEFEQELYSIDEPSFVADCVFGGLALCCIDFALAAEHLDDSICHRGHSSLVRPRS